uniref:Uncharacterized protein n=1 Tax=Arundo donax TaxID=35708 RepID=A0A0A8ZXU1_ARUDO
MGTHLVIKKASFRRAARSANWKALLSSNAILIWGRPLALRLIMYILLPSTARPSSTAAMEKDHTGFTFQAQ